MIKHDFEKLSKHEAEEKVKVILSFLEIETSGEDPFHRNNEKAEQAAPTCKIAKPLKWGETHPVS